MTPWGLTNDDFPAQMRLKTPCSEVSMKLIEKRKLSYSVTLPFSRYLRQYDRGIKLPVCYDELHDYVEALPLYDAQGNDTLWSTLCYAPAVRRPLHDALLEIYSHLRAPGTGLHVRHLEVDRIDLCLYANTSPFRVRVINRLNDNFDYFYIKKADMSRIFGLELEHLLSPNRISYLYSGDTLIEEHIYGIPGDVFLEKKLEQDETSRVRLAKEFVKFNERCVLRLLGDMHAANFVIDITMDFEQNFYRIRSIDFDQQCFEPSLKVYLPQFFKQNFPYVKLVLDHLPIESVHQYQQEERAQFFRRTRSEILRLEGLFDALEGSTLAPHENITSLRAQLADYYENRSFMQCDSMVAMIKLILRLIETKSLPSGFKRPVPGLLTSEVLSMD
jgi:hypothetical protein